MTPVSYPLDLTGVNPTNKVGPEPHVVTEVNPSSKMTLVPNFGPMFESGIQLFYENEDGHQIELFKGIDFDLSLIYIGASRALEQKLWGGVTLHRAYDKGMFYLTYQTLGDKWVANRDHVLERLANAVYNPRAASYDNVSGIPEVFPAGAHEQPLETFKGMEDLIASIDRVTNSVIEKYQSPLTSTAEYLKAMTEIERVKLEVAQLRSEISNNRDNR